MPGVYFVSHRVLCECRFIADFPEMHCSLTNESMSSNGSRRVVAVLRSSSLLLPLALQPTSSSAITASSTSTTTSTSTSSRRCCTTLPLLLAAQPSLKVKPRFENSSVSSGPVVIRTSSLLEIPYFTPVTSQAIPSIPSSKPTYKNFKYEI